MRQFAVIAINAFKELVQQPVFLLLTVGSAAFAVFLAAVPYFGFGDDPKLVKDSVLALIFLVGLFAAVTSASASVAHEIRSGTALAVLAKPVGRARFLLAKYAGLAAALTVLVYLNLIAALLASRSAFDAYGDADLRATFLFYGALALAFAVGGFTNYFLRRPFVWDTVLALCVLAPLALVVIVLLTEHRSRSGELYEVDWRLIPAVMLILFALLILAGVALACSTRFDMIPTLALCTGVFLLGLTSDYFFGRPAAAGAWWAQVLYTLTPNWQLFWLADALEPEKTIPWSYVGKAFGYVAAYLGATLALALILFEDRELN
jgi:ABC-type transport system involved in multi-copper enzyme maturation permease subunit